MPVDDGETYLGLGIASFVFTDRLKCSVDGGLWVVCYGIVVYLSSPLSINHSVFEPCMKDVDSEFHKSVSQ